MISGRAIGWADRAPLPSQALAAPCGNFHLTQLLAGGTDTGPSLPVTLPLGPGGCGGGSDPPPPPPDCHRICEGSPKRAVPGGCCRLEQSPRRHVVGSGDLPEKTTKDGKKVVSCGHMEPDAGEKKKLSRNLKRAEIAIEARTIDGSKGTADPKSDVEVLAHERGGHAAPFGQPEKYAALIGDKVQEAYAGKYGKDVAADPATKAAPTPEEYAEAAKMLNLEDVTETTRQEANDPREVLGRKNGE